MLRNIAYLRASTLDQDLEKNKLEILHLANEKNLGKVEYSLLTFLLSVFFVSAGVCQNVWKFLPFNCSRREYKYMELGIC